MKKVLILFQIFVLVIGMAACSDNSSSTPDQKETVTTTRLEAETAVQAATHTAADQTVSPTAATGTPLHSETAQPTEQKSAFDPYATENDYNLSSAWFERQYGTDYGTLLTDVTYYSTTAEDDKRVNILLPPGYDENSAYPVLYMIHGWGGDYTGHLYEGSYQRRS